MKDVSIVLCPFNNNEHFKRVFHHIITRTHYDFSKIEVIVVDNNTEADLKKEIANFVADNASLVDVTYIENNNVGQLAQATNRAIEIASSKWLVYLCATDTYIYDPQWLVYLTENLSDSDKEEGYRIAGTITPWPNYLKDESKHYHVQGAVFIAFTEYMKQNPYSLEYPFDHCDVIHSAKCLEQGYKIKHLPRIISHMGHASLDWHQGVRRSKEFLIAHVHGLHEYP